MDFHTMKRKELQALCKKHGIPANLTNAEMANKLASLLEEKEKPVTRGRSCLKNLGEIANENDLKDANLKVKKVRFSPINEMIEFVDLEMDQDRDNSPIMTRAVRRKSMIRPLAIENDAKTNISERTVGNPVKVLRSRVQKSIEVVLSPPVQRKARRGTKSVGATVNNVCGSDKPPPVMELADNVDFKNANVKGQTRWRLRSREVVGEGQQEARAEETGREMKRQLRNGKVIIENQRESEDGGVAALRKNMTQKSSKRTKKVGGGDGIISSNEISDDKVVGGEGESNESGNLPRRSKRNAMKKAKDCELFGAESRQIEMANRDTQSRTQLVEQEASTVETGKGTGIATKFKVGDEPEVVLHLEEPSRGFGRKASRRKSVAPQNGKVRSDGPPVENEARMLSRNGILDEEASEIEPSKENGKVSFDSHLRRSQRTTSILKSVAPAKGEVGTSANVGSLELKQCSESVSVKEAPLREEHWKRRSTRHAARNDLAATHKQMDVTVNSIGKEKPRKQRRHPVADEETVNEHEPLIEGPPGQFTHNASRCESVAIAELTGKAVGRKLRDGTEALILEMGAPSINSKSILEELDAGLSVPEAVQSLNNPEFSHGNKVAVESKKRKGSERKSSAKKQYGSIKSSSVIPDAKKIEDLVTTNLEGTPPKPVKLLNVATDQETKVSVREYEISAENEEISTEDENGNELQDYTNNDKDFQACHPENRREDADNINPVEPDSMAHKITARDVDTCEITSPADGLSPVCLSGYVGLTTGFLDLGKELEAGEEPLAGQHMRPSSIVADHAAAKGKASEDYEKNIKKFLEADRPAEQIKHKLLLEDLESVHLNKNTLSVSGEAGVTVLLNPCDEGLSPNLSEARHINEVEEPVEAIEFQQIISLSSVATAETAMETFLDIQLLSGHSTLKPSIGADHHERNHTKYDFVVQPTASHESNTDRAEGEEHSSHDTGNSKRTTFGDKALGSNANDGIRSEERTKEAVVEKENELKETSVIDRSMLASGGEIACLDSKLKLDVEFPRLDSDGQDARHLESGGLERKYDNSSDETAEKFMLELSDGDGICPPTIQREEAQCRVQSSILANTAFSIENQVTSSNDAEMADSTMFEVEVFSGNVVTGSQWKSQEALGLKEIKHEGMVKVLSAPRNVSKSITDDAFKGNFNVEFAGVDGSIYPGFDKSFEGEKSGEMKQNFEDDLDEGERTSFLDLCVAPETTQLISEERGSDNTDFVEEVPEMHGSIAGGHVLPTNTAGDKDAEVKYGKLKQSPGVTSSLTPVHTPEFDGPGVGYKNMSVKKSLSKDNVIERQGGNEHEVFATSLNFLERQEASLHETGNRVLDVSITARVDVTEGKADGFSVKKYFKCEYGEDLEKEGVEAEFFHQSASKKSSEGERLRMKEICNNHPSQDTFEDCTAEKREKAQVSLDGIVSSSNSQQVVGQDNGGADSHLLVSIFKESEKVSGDRAPVEMLRNYECVKEIDALKEEEKGILGLDQVVLDDGDEFTNINYSSSGASGECVREESSEELFDEATKEESIFPVMEADLKCNNAEDISLEVESGNKPQRLQLMSVGPDDYKVEEEVQELKQSNAMALDGLASADSETGYERVKAEMMEGKFNFKDNNSSSMAVDVGASLLDTEKEFGEHLSKEVVEVQDIDHNHICERSRVVEDKAFTASVKKTDRLNELEQEGNSQSVGPLGLSWNVLEHEVEFTKTNIVSPGSSKETARVEGEDPEEMSDEFAGFMLQDDDVINDNIEDDEEAMVLGLEKGAFVASDAEKEEVAEAKEDVETMQSNTSFKDSSNSTKVGEDIDASQLVAIEDFGNHFVNKHASLNESDPDVIVHHLCENSTVTMDDAGIAIMDGRFSSEDTKDAENWIENALSSSQKQNNSQNSSEMKLFNASSCSKPEMGSSGVSFFHGAEYESHAYDMHTRVVEGKKAIDEDKGCSPTPMDMPFHEDNEITVEKNKEARKGGIDLRYTKDGSYQVEESERNFQGVDEEVVGDDECAMEEASIVEEAELHNFAHTIDDKAACAGDFKQFADIESLHDGSLNTEVPVDCSAVSPGANPAHHAIGTPGNNKVHEIEGASEANYTYQGSHDAREVEENMVTMQKTEEQLVMLEDRMEEEVAELNATHVALSDEPVCEGGKVSKENDMVNTTKDHIDCKDNMSEFMVIKNSDVSTLHKTNAEGEFKNFKLENIFKEAMPDKKQFEDIVEAMEVHEMIFNPRSRIVDQSPPFINSAIDRAAEDTNMQQQKELEFTHRKNLGAKMEEGNSLSTKKLNSSMAKRKNIGTSLIPRTRKNVLRAVDMKENTPSTKTQPTSNITTMKSVSRRRALEDLQKK